VDHLAVVGVERASGQAAGSDGLYGGAWQLGPWELHPLALLFVASGSLMISTVRIPKL
jgi:CDP-diacylglycerol--serine O-phosphatidyltransferase